MKVEYLENFKGNIYITNHFDKSGINIEDTSNALILKNPIQVEALIGDAPITVSNSFTFGKDGFSLRIYGAQDWFSDYSFKRDNFNLNNAVIYDVYNNLYLNAGHIYYDGNETTFDLNEWVVNAGDTTFKISDFALFNFQTDQVAGNFPFQTKNKIEFDSNCLTIENNMWYQYNDGSQTDNVINNQAKLTLNDSLLSIDIKHANVEGYYYLGQQCANYQFKHDGLYVNGHAPNTANGFVVLDSNSQIPFNLLPQNESFIEQITKSVSSYTTEGVVTIDDLSSGLIIAVVDNNGRQVYPDIQYNERKCATISAVYQNQQSNATWTIYKEKSKQINYFDTLVENAELFDTATNLGDFAINVGNNKVAYWTRNTVVPTTGNIYFAQGVSNSNIWFKLEDKNIGGALYGLPGSQTLNGDIHFYSKNSSFRNGAIGGAASSKCRDIYVTLENVETKGAFYCSMGEADNYYINLNGGTYGDSSNVASDFYVFQRGSGLNNTKVTTNDIYFTCNGGTFNANLIIGPNVKTKNTQTSLCCEVHDITAVLNDGFIDNETADSTSCNIYCGWISGQNNIPTASLNDIKLIINGGQWFDNINLENGKGIYSGPAVTNGIATVNNCYLQMNGGDASILFSGGYVQNNAKLDILGDIKIVFNGGVVGNLLAVETADSIASNNGYIRVHGNSYIYINGGTIKGVVNPSNKHIQSLGKEIIDGERYVVLSGNTNYDCIFNGGLNNNTTRDSIMIFENYTGTLESDSVLEGFKSIVFKKNTNIIFNGTWTNNSNSYDIDMSRRSVDYADSFIVQGIPQPGTINLTLSDTISLQNEWKIMDNIDTLPVINIVYNNTILTTISNVNTPISNTNTVLDGYQFKIEERNLILYKGL